LDELHEPLKMTALQMIDLVRAWLNSLPRSLIVGAMHLGKLMVDGAVTFIRPLARLGRPQAALLLALAFMGTGCQALSTRIVSDPGPAAARLKAGGSVAQEVDRLAQPLTDSREIRGVAVGVLTPDGQTSVFGYGQTATPSGRGSPDGNTIFQIGSLSKLFLTALLAVLVDEGALRYDETVREILPADVRLNHEVGQLTLYELATNTGGFPRQPFCLGQLRDLTLFVFTGQNLYAYIDKPYLYKYIRRKQIKPKQSRKYVYSNIGYGLLTHLIEVKTGRTFHDLLDEKICQPLNLRDTTLALSDEQQERLATGHVGTQPRFMRRGQPLQPWDMGEIMRPSTCLYSTVNDLMIFAKANLGMLSHQLEPALASTQRAQWSRPTEDVAFGWLINYLGDDRLKVIYKHGMVAGYSGYIGVEPENRIAVIALYNTFSWDDKLGHNLLLRLSRGLAPKQRIGCSEHSK
jgi:CubicO group peptidase (beta-lactamase class C family)